MWQSGSIVHVEKDPDGGIAGQEEIISVWRKKSRIYRVLIGEKIPSTIQWTDATGGKYPDRARGRDTVNKR
ncbi:MAG: hypothetical protein KGY60_12995 [Bacteroidales bacterium]|nr:hypothetical protein [Bacteroidales bacterium]